LLGVAARVLEDLEGPQTVNTLWEGLKNEPVVGTFDRFVLALDVLFLVGAVEWREGLLQVPS